MKPTWRVGAILNESLADTFRFVSWYLSQGADGITLLFDDPNDPAIAALSHNPKIECISCTEKFWESLGTNQSVQFTRRQNIGLTWVYHRTQEDWLLNVDCDEFVYVEDRSIHGFLHQDCAECDAIRIQTAEVVAPTFDHDNLVFRRPMPRDKATFVYGTDLELFGPRRQGLIGHPIGKSFIKTGYPNLTLRQHWADRTDGTEQKSRDFDGSSGAYLLHFIGLDYEAWLQKLEWRLASRGFTTPLKMKIRNAMDGPDPAAELREIHARLHQVTPEVYARMLEADVVLELDPNLMAEL